MTADWPRVPLGEVLQKSADWITLDPETVYSEVTVKLWGKGVTLRREVSGAEIAGTQRLRVRPDQFIASRIDARNGAFGLIPKPLNGAVVTNDFPVFDIDEQNLEPRFLDWMSKTTTFVDLCKAASEGTTNRVRLKEDKFLATPIPLPPLAEQRRIVARVEAIAARVTEARRLREEAAADTKLLITSAADAIFAQLLAEYGSKRFADFEPHVTSGPRNWAARYAEGGLRFYRAQDILTDGRLATSGKVFIEPPDSNQGQSAQLRSGDLMLVITGATVGRVTEYPADVEPGYVSQHVAICRLPHAAINSRFALWRLLSGYGQAELTGQRYGQGKPGLNLTNIRNLTLPVPSLAEQRRVVAYLDALQAKADAVRSLQAATAAELDALLPAVLNRAFAGVVREALVFD